MPVALVNEELVLYRAECNISSGFALCLHGGGCPPAAAQGKRDPEDARGSLLPGEPPLLPGDGDMSGGTSWASGQDVGTLQELGMFACFRVLFLVSIFRRAS